MEPDEIQRLYESIHTYDIMRKTQDLSSISTRDLLNECYRRRAIEKFSVDRNADEYMVQNDRSYTEYVMDHIRKEVWFAVMDNKKFLPEAVPIKHAHDSINRMHRYTAEVYVCKHPMSLKK